MKYRIQWWVESGLDGRWSACGVVEDKSPIGLAEKSQAMIDARLEAMRKEFGVPPPDLVTGQKVEE